MEIQRSKGNRLAKQVSLSEIDTGGEESLKLLGSLYALGRHCNVEVLRQCPHGGKDSPAIPSSPETLGDVPVDLDLVERKA